jgi:hypothetical protein
MNSRVRRFVMNKRNKKAVKVIGIFGYVYEKSRNILYMF